MRKDNQSKRKQEKKKGKMGEEMEQTKQMTRCFISV